MIFINDNSTEIWWNQLVSSQRNKSHSIEQFKFVTSQVNVRISVCFHGLTWTNQCRAAPREAADWLLRHRNWTVVGGVYVFLLTYFHNDDKKNIKNSYDVRGRAQWHTRKRRRSFGWVAVCLNQSHDREKWPEHNISCASTPPAK